MGVIVTFNYAAWIALFPQFGVTTPQFTALTEMQVTTLILPLAESYNRNDGGGPVCDVQTQTNLLNLMVAHVAQLLFGSSTQPLSALVGRVSSASEGSVSVSADFPTTPNNAWFLQTPFGAAWYQLSLPYRLGRYVPKITPQYQPFTGYRGGW
jgi:hypothetical protein